MIRIAQLFVHWSHSQCTGLGALEWLESQWSTQCLWMLLGQCVCDTVNDHIVFGDLGGAGPCRLPDGIWVTSRQNSAAWDASRYQIVASPQASF
jgi:hypothetical protein